MAAKNVGCTGPLGPSTPTSFANYRFSFRKLQIFISQNTDFHFAKYKFSFRKLQISQNTDFHFVSFRFVSFRFANYSKPMSLKYVRSIRKLKIRLFTVWNVFLLYCLFGWQGRRHNTLYHSVFDVILVQLNEWIPVLLKCH